MMVTLEILAGLLLVLTLPGSLYLATLTLAARIHKPPTPVVAMPGRMAIVVPAHNEAAGIAATLGNLLPLAREDGNAEVIVVADNCSDETAAIATGCGARVLARQNPDLRGKGYALDFAFNHLLKEDFSAFVVVDADSRAAPYFLLRLRQHFARGARAIQSRYTVLNVNDSARTQLFELALQAFNVLRPMGRSRLGFSAGILGNGFALRSDVLREVPYTAASVVEDLEYHLRLIEAGVKVEFASDALIRGEMPTTGTGAASQRARWEGGRLRMLLDHAPALMQQAFTGHWRFVEPLLDLLLLPLAYHVFFLLLLCVLPFPLASFSGFLGLLIVVWHVAVAARLGGMGGRQLFKTLCSVPAYLVWKLVRIGFILRSARQGSAWVRTERNFKEAR